MKFLLSLSIASPNAATALPSSSLPERPGACRWNLNRKSSSVKVDLENQKFWVVIVPFVKE
jgi:hypothetical protein